MVEWNEWENNGNYYTKERGTHVQFDERERNSDVFIMVQVPLLGIL